ncbi:VOC family protein [Gemelliphila palaticanis]|uniref:VOC family protein n=1 Tax=Gemelliphila palaticanis TaxID=81950 RepID=A0ABX2T300_9BACL|nr:VOC family protein [Gemella palaticanis]MBF0715466.1 VOC family protein [Gemella palaticanis]NYS47396.1 VOC family protein [Gemella palaticanis]
MKNTGIHHISTLIGDIRTSYNFYHNILGMKLILKTVNQDDSTMYHLFFGDETGRAGTEFTIFEMKNYPENKFGTNAIERTYFLVKSEESIKYWEERLESFDVCHYGIEEYNGKKILRFEDSDGMKLGFVYKDTDMKEMDPYVHPDINPEHAILGIGEVHFRVRYTEPTEQILTNFFEFEKYNEIVDNDFKVSLLKIKDNPFGHEIHIIEDKKSQTSFNGVGGIHHIAFGVESIEDLELLQQKLDDKNFTSSGIVDREFIKSSYFRDPNFLLFEVATPLTKEKKDLPEQNKPFDEIPLFLPDFLEHDRQVIETNVDYKF